NTPLSRSSPRVIAGGSGRSGRETDNLSELLVRGSVLMESYAMTDTKQVPCQPRQGLSALKTSRQRAGTRQIARKWPSLGGLRTKPARGAAPVLKRGESL